MLETPVVLVIFNRPDFTERVFGAIAKAKPRRLFVLADGPRSPDEAVLCEETRALTRNVDWDCEVTEIFSDVNLGCRQRCASGFDWVFSQVETAIFLEDDCVPDLTFFSFCDTMLDQYRDDPRVMMVTGSNYLGTWKADLQSYHFSYFGSPWGWASWRRAWKFYDVTMNAWSDDATKKRIRDILADDECFALQARRFDYLLANPDEQHSWDLPWSFTRLSNAGLTVVPSVNLISNLGCLGGNSLPSTHPIANLPSAPLRFPIRIQDSVAVDRLYDKRHIERLYEGFHQGGGGYDGESGPRNRRLAGKIRRRLARMFRTVGG
jgi:hypothetical protein